MSTMVIDVKPLHPNVQSAAATKRVGATSAPVAISIAVFGHTRLPVKPIEPCQRPLHATNWGHLPLT